MTCATAPGKIILFGEHAVVYNRPALAVPVTQVHAHVEITASQQAGIWFDAPDISLRAEISTLSPSNALRHVVEGILKFHGQSSPPSLTIHITSTIPVASGLGSGAAVSVAIIRALSAFLSRPISDEQTNQIAYDVEKIHHGTPSGIDNTVITYARPVFFVRGMPIETFSAARPFSIVIGDTGIPALTKESVGDVRKLWGADKTHWETVFEKVGKIAREARNALESGDNDRLGPLMDANHALLQEMTVSSPELDRLVAAAKAAQAEGAKLSGGGRGGNMIALVRPENAEKIASVLQAAGARRTIITSVQ